MALRFLFAVFFATTSSLCLAQPPQLPLEGPERPAGFPGAGTAETRATAFPAAGVRLVRPEGFEDAENFHGFQQEATQSSVMVLSVPGPFAELTGGFTAAQLEAKGMKLLSKEEVSVDGTAGVLVNVTQEAFGIKFAKWILAFGDKAETKMIIATFPATDGSGLSQRLKAAVLSVKTDDAARPDLAANAGFTIAGSQKLKLGHAIGKNLLYTKNGAFPAESPQDPFFIAGPSISKTVIVDTNDYAKKRFLQIAHTKVRKVTSHKRITIDGLEGYETIADGELTGSQKPSENGTPLKVYQTILFGDGTYFLMQGLVGAEFAEEYLPEFQKMARSLKRTDK